ncbi:hypothetical protein BC629DRAFT_1586875 [Irpex lacteus]|nr:hypothetical protein BC629DRAFT_1586875 [Irpex lacteus]
MSFLLGPVSGALVAGGVYYGFSTLIHSRTLKHQIDLHNLSTRLLDSSAITTAPLPAVERIQHRPFVSQVKSQWNNQVETLFRGISDINRKAGEWTKRTLYGQYPGPKKV